MLVVSEETRESRPVIISKGKSDTRPQAGLMNGAVSFLLVIIITIVIDEYLGMSGIKPASENNPAHKTRAS
jgi:hypothetical protein